MGVKQSKFITADMSLEEKRFYAERCLPEMYKRSYAIIPLMLTLPVFTVARAAAAQIDSVWTRKGGGTVRYIGPQLCQSHLTVLLGLAHLRRGDVVSAVITFSPSAFLAAIGWSDNARNKKRLANILDDLHVARLRVWGVTEKEEHAARVSIISSWKPDEGDNQKWSVSLCNTVLRLFDGHLTRLDMEKRQKLKEGLATFLYGYVSANSCQLPFSYEELHSAAGCAGVCNAEFAKEVRARLDTMRILGVIEDFKAERGGVRVKKK